MRAAKAERGAVLLTLVLLFALLIASGIVVLMYLTSFRYNESKNQIGTWQAKLLAESGISDAMGRLSIDPFWRSDGSESYPLLRNTLEKAGSYEVRTELVSFPNRLSLISTGKASRGIFTVQNDIALSNPALFALLAEEVRLSENARVNGPVSVAGDLFLYGASLINGSVQVGKEWSGPSRSIAGDITIGVTSYCPLEYDTLKRNYLLTGFQKLSQPDLSNAKLSDSTYLAIGRCEATGLDLAKSTLIVDGDLIIQGHAALDAGPARAAILVGGNLIVEESGKLDGIGFVFVAGKFINRGQCNLRGTIHAQKIDAGGSFLIQPDISMVYQSILGFPHSVKTERCRYPPNAQ